MALGLFLDWKISIPITESEFSVRVNWLFFTRDLLTKGVLEHRIRGADDVSAVRNTSRSMTINVYCNICQRLAGYLGYQIQDVNSALSNHVTYHVISGNAYDLRIVSTESQIPYHHGYRCDTN